MKKVFGLFIVMLLLGFSGVSAGIYTADDYTTALAHAGEKDQHIMIKFYTDW